MDLRDQLAMHFAASLVDAFPNPEGIARRAYDLAEAMLSERARRIDAEEAHAIAMESWYESLSAPPPEALYDEDLESRWLPAEYDPSWDLDPRWSAEPSRPGLARTQAEEEEERKKRLA